MRLGQSNLRFDDAVSCDRIQALPSHIIGFVIGDCEADHCNSIQRLGEFMEHRISAGFGRPLLNRKSLLQQIGSLTTIIPVALLVGLLLTSAPPVFAQTETVLYSFANNGADGYQPYAALTPGTNGTLYGTSNLGGANGYGTVSSSPRKISRPRSSTSTPE
jgi:hypothetical protein